MVTQHERDPGLAAAIESRPLRIDFTGKAFLITGAASGIGEAIALALGELGARVVAADLDPDRLRTVVARIGAAGGDATATTLDVTDREACSRLAADLAAQPLSGLVNCAGILLGGASDAPDVHSVWDRMYQVNAAGTFNVTTAFIPQLKQTRGTVLNISSASATSGRNRNVAYQASKAAVSQMTRGWAVELAEHGIRVNAVAPGIIVTPLTLPTRQDPVRLDRILSRVPLARFGYPREVAAAAVFLLSDLATYITGAILPIDGGSTCN